MSLIFKKYFATIFIKFLPSYLKFHQKFLFISNLPKISLKFSQKFFSFWTFSEISWKNQKLFETCTFFIANIYSNFSWNFANVSLKCLWNFLKFLQRFSRSFLKIYSKILYTNLFKTCSKFFQNILNIIFMKLSQKFHFFLKKIYSKFHRKLASFQNVLTIILTIFWIY